jgi:hypothetical protein
VLDFFPPHATRASAPAATQIALDLGARKIERAGCDDRSRLFDLRQNLRDVDAEMMGRVAGETMPCLRQLPLTTHGVSPSRLVPRHRDMDEALVEVAFFRLGGPPRRLQLFVRREELAAADQLEPAAKLLRP